MPYRQLYRIADPENLKLIAVSTFSSIAAFFTPINGFVYSMVILFAFNIFCGMRADGVAISRCNNFSMRKFSKSALDLLIYLMIVHAVYSAMSFCGDSAEALIVVKTLTYVFMYFYMCNAVKNLIIAYPANKAFRILYHIVRFEFTKALPSYVQQVIDRYHREHKD